MTDSKEEDGPSEKAAADRKASRKQAKALQILQKDYPDIGEVGGGAASLYVMVCNAGLVTGCSQADLLTLFSKYGPIDNLVLVPKKSYSFVVFRNSEDAQNAMESISGKVGFSDKGPIYLLYVTRVPAVESQWTGGGCPPGLQLVEEFVSGEEEEELMGLFSAGNPDSQQEMKNRVVKHFGFEFDYKTNDIDAEKPLDTKLPPSCQALVDRMVERGMVEEGGDQLTVNMYQPGQGIPLHTDTHSCCTDWLVSVSLGSGIVMDFRGPAEESVPVWLPSRSLLILKEEARYCWRHGIAPRHSDIVPEKVCGGEGEGLTLVPRGNRVSLTFRKTLLGNCKCNFPRFCNRPKEVPSLEIMSQLEKTASMLESQLVHQVYEEIASHFSETRHKPWPKVVNFIKSIPCGDVLVDLGCGNGKYLGQDTENTKFELGGDFSENLLRIVRDRGLEGVRMDLLSPPLRDCAANGIICIAALHHLSTEERRVNAIKEMSRILVSGGRVLVYVWAKDQKKENMSSYLKQNKSNFKQESSEVVPNETGEFGLPLHVNRTQFQHQDVLVPWKLKQEEGEDRVFKRYYHVFEEGELETLFGAVESFRIVESYYDQGNWCVIAQKL